MNVTTQTSANITNWSQHPKSRLITDKGVIIRHIEGRTFYPESGDADSIWTLDDKGVLKEDGHAYPQTGKLSPELADVTEQLRLIWLQEQERGADYVNPHEERQEQRRERYSERAQKARAEGSAAVQRAHNMAPNPPDQPILIGHHSEGRHRRTLQKMDNLYRHAFVECADKANHYESKANGVGRGGISGSDPDALRKLLEKLQGVMQSHQIMKASNAAIRRNKTPEKQTAALLALGLSESNVAELLGGDCFNNIGFASFQLTGNNAEIKRLQKRIKELQIVEEEATDTEEEHEGFTMKIDGEENRIMFIFDGKPADEIRTLLKSYAFKWSPSRGAWVRQTTRNALYSAERMKAELIEKLS